MAAGFSVIKLSGSINEKPSSQHSIVFAYITSQQKVSPDQIHWVCSSLVPNGPHTSSVLVYFLSLL